MIPGLKQSRASSNPNPILKDTNMLTPIYTPLEFLVYQPLFFLILAVSVTGFSILSIEFGVFMAKLVWKFLSVFAAIPVCIRYIFLGVEDVITMDGHALETKDADIIKRITSSRRAVDPDSGRYTARLRPRSKVVCKMQELLGGRGGIVGRLFHGRWDYDLANSRNDPMTNATLTLLKEQVKILGVGYVNNYSGDVKRSVPYFVVQNRNGDQDTIYPELLGLLSAHACLRERDASLVFGLRARASLWCKNNLPTWLRAQAMAPAISRAYAVSDAEARAMRAITRVDGMKTPFTHPVSAG